MAPLPGSHLGTHGRALWKLTAPWTHRTRPPRLGQRCAFSTSFHRAFPSNHPRKTPKGPKIALGNPDRPQDFSPQETLSDPRLSERAQRSLYSRGSMSAAAPERGRAGRSDPAQRFRGSPAESPRRPRRPSPSNRLESPVASSPRARDRSGRRAPGGGSRLSTGAEAGTRAPSSASLPRAVVPDGRGVVRASWLTDLGALWGPLEGDDSAGDVAVRGGQAAACVLPVATVPLDEGPD